MNETLSKVFTLQSRLVMVGWFILAALPFWQYMPAAVMAIILIICVTYSYFVFFGHRYDDGARKPSFKDFAHLKGVMKLFTNPRAVLGGWLHYLAFDLLVGLIIVLDAQQHAISHWFILPILFFSLMIGPAGLVLYFVFRAVYIGDFLNLGLSI